jgi:hypothetical protein
MRFQLAKLMPPPFWTRGVFFQVTRPDSEIEPAVRRQLQGQLQKLTKQISSS